MTRLWLEIENFPNCIKLYAKVQEDGKAPQDPIDLPVISKEPRFLVYTNLCRVLNGLNEYRDKNGVAPNMTLATLDEFMILNEFMPFNRLVYIYRIYVLGYTLSQLYEKVEARKNDLPLFSLLSTHSGRYPWGDKSRPPITVDHIFYDDVATVVFWTDGTKTVVKCAEGTPYDEYSAFCIALAKKIYGNNSALKRAIKNHARYSKKRQIIKTLCGETSKDVKHGDTFVITNEENKDA